jgi:hypothetical protein
MGWFGWTYASSSIVHKSFKLVDGTRANQVELTILDSRDSFPKSRFEFGRNRLMNDNAFGRHADLARVEEGSKNDLGISYCVGI